MAFQLPDLAGQYCRVIENRCLRLIKRGVWTGIEPTRLRSWLNNFNGDLEQYFAAHLLDALIYRSDLQTRALARQLFERAIPDHARSSGLDLGPNSELLLQLLATSPNGSKLRIVPVRPANATGKSGDHIVRMLRRHLHIKEGWMVPPERIPESIAAGVNIFVFVDDFLGTGTQFDQFYLATNVQQYAHLANFIYAPLVSHEVGVRYVEKRTHVTVTSAEMLAKRNRLFGANGIFFCDSENTPSDAKEFYHSLLTKYNINVAGHQRRGYGHLEVAYAFEHAAPDNSLLLYWWNKSDQWVPLVDR